MNQRLYTIRCPYFLGGRSEPCEVIVAMDLSMPHDLQLRLKSQYCNSGLFIGCPLHRRVQHRLERHGDRLRQMVATAQ